jgi:hypothetical protein
MDDVCWEGRRSTSVGRSVGWERRPSSLAAVGRTLGLASVAAPEKTDEGRLRGLQRPARLAPCARARAHESAWPQPFRQRDRVIR